MIEILYRCPCCAREGFTAAGLHKHRCRAKPERAPLTLVEIAAAKPVEPAEQNLPALQASRARMKTDNPESVFSP